MAELRIHVLLVEDNPGDAILVEESLHSAGECYQVKRLVMLGEVPRAIAEAKTPFDVMLLDLTLPDSAGTDTFTRAQQMAPQMAIVVLTGADETMGMDLVSMGAQDYLVKGQFDGRLLSRSIRYATQRNKIELELRQARDELEMRVKQRTAELEQAITVLGEEVSDRTSVEQALRESEERFRQMADAMPEVIWMASPDLGRMLYVNAAYEKVWGRPRETLFAQPTSWIQAVHPSQREQVLADLRQWLDTCRQGSGGQRYLEFRIVRPDESIVGVRCRTFPIRDLRGMLLRVCAITTDITSTES